MNRIVKYVIIDILRSRVIFFYTLVLAVLAWSILLLEDSGEKGMLSLLNIILLIVPLISIIFSTIYLYNSFEFIELLIAQPLKRARVWVSIFTGLNIAFLISFLVAAGIPIAAFSFNEACLYIIIAGILISLVFTSLAFLSAISFRDKTKGIGFSILLWLFVGFIFDGIVMFILFQFGDYPIEPFIIVLASLNPIDLARISVLLQMDMTAMLGYTGALFKDYFGNLLGMFYSILMMIMWIIAPFMISVIKFAKKDH